jgi:hypothetical protein
VLIGFSIHCATLGRGIRSSGAFAQSGAQVNRPTMLFQHIGERFICQFLERHHAVAREQIESRPALVVQPYALAGHCVSFPYRIMTIFRNLLAIFAGLGEPIAMACLLASRGSNSGGEESSQRRYTRWEPVGTLRDYQITTVLKRGGDT